MKEAIAILIKYIKKFIRIVLWMVLSPIWIIKVLWDLAIQIEAKETDLANRIQRRLK